MEILKKSFEDHNGINKRQPSGFLVAEPENLKFQRVPTKEKTNKQAKKGCISKTKKADRRLLESL